MAIDYTGKNSPFNKAVLQVSSPRSGSTLLANILRSSSELLLINEVFTKAPYLLPKFEADYHQKLTDVNKYQNEFLDIYKYTLPFGKHMFYRSKQIRFIVNLLAKLYNNLESRFERDKYNSLSYLFWYINSLHQPLLKPLYQTTFGKSASCKIHLKEVRIKKSIEGFHYLFNNSKTLFLIRHPYGFLSSTMRSRKENSTDIPITKSHLISEYGYQNIIEQFDGSKEAKFLLTWRLSNEWAMDYFSVGEACSDYLILTYEDLVMNPSEKVSEIFRFLNIEMDKNTLNILKSLKGFQGSQQHSRSIFKPQMGKIVLENYIKDFDLKKVNRILYQSPLLERFSYRLL